MTWNAYNRRKEVLHDVLAIADRRRDGVTATELLAEVSDADRFFTSEVDLLLDAQMVWAQALSRHMDSNVFLGEGTLESSAIDAWQSAASELPGLRALLDSAVDMSEMNAAFAKEHEFLARAVGIPANHPDIDGHGRRVKAAAAASMVYAPVVTDGPASIIGRIREALAA